MGIGWWSGDWNERRYRYRCVYLFVEDPLRNAFLSKLSLILPKLLIWFLSLSLFPAVNQYYEAQVYDVFVIKGNAALFKCQIPSFVADHVEITEWVTTDEQTFSLDDNFGRHTNSPVKLTTSQSSVFRFRKFSVRSFGSKLHSFVSIIYVLIRSLQSCLLNLFFSSIIDPVQTFHGSNGLPIPNKRSFFP